MIVPRKGDQPILDLDYNLDEITTFQGTRYCQGRILYRDGAQRNVTFVFYSDEDSALEGFYNCADPDSNHRALVKSWSYSDELRTQQPLHVVSFDPFMGFFTEIPQDFTRPVNRDVPWLPPTWVQDLILDLLDAIKRLNFHGKSLRFLHQPTSYVWCEGNKLKLIMVNKRIENFDSETWQCRLEVDISRLKVFLKDHILVGTPGTAWPERGVFLEGFDPAYNSKGSNISPAVRLEMISDDPFLRKSRTDMFRVLLEVDQGVHKDVLHMEKYDAILIEEALSNPELLKKVCGTDFWKSKIKGTCFKAYLDQRIIDYKVNVDYHSLQDLVHHVRNAFQHNRVPINTLYDEVRVHFPILFNQVKWHYVDVHN